MKPTHEGENYKLYMGDAIQTMKEEIAAGSVDAIICDPPY
jgi:DNA modification methylase